MTNTNDYANFQKAVDWQPIVLSEMLIFITILLIYSVRSAPRIKDLWKKDDLFVCPLISILGMSYAKWALIRKFLHISPVIVPENFKVSVIFRIFWHNDRRDMKKFSD